MFENWPIEICYTKTSGTPFGAAVTPFNLIKYKYASCGLMNRYSQLPHHDRYALLYSSPIGSIEILEAEPIWRSRGALEKWK